MKKLLEYVDLASERIGGKVLLANDEFFAPKENLIKPEAPIFIEGKYTEFGKWMDGWETRRRRTPGHDWCILRLGRPGRIHGVNINTAFFLGNHPPFASIDGAASTSDSLSESDWKNILKKSPLKKGSDNFFSIKNSNRYTHLRLNIFPDGGVARLRVFGEVLCDWEKMPANDLIDLAAVENGGRVLACNDMFFGPKDNLIMPGRGKNMGDGWETKRKRKPGYDWVIIQLGHLGIVKKLLIDTAHFKGNFPDQCSVDAGIKRGKTIVWSPLLRRSRLQANHEHWFEDEINCPRPITHLRLNIFPDGGISRLRAYGLISNAKA